MRTQDEIVAKIEASKDFLDFTGEAGEGSGVDGPAQPGERVMAAQHDDNAPPTAEELAALDRDLAEVKAGQAGWGQAEANAMKLLPRLFRAHKALLADADTYVYHEGKAAGRKEAVEWLRARAAKTDAEVGDDCDGQDADRLCNEASLLYGAANDFARGSEP